MTKILEDLKDHQVVIVSAAPGSGKSSVLPRLLGKSSYGPVICAQPRHFASCVASAKAGEEWQSNVAFTTTRRLLDAFREIRPPQRVLAAFHAVVIDEAHDRSTLCTDVLLTMVRAALTVGEMEPLRIVVCTH